MGDAGLLILPYEAALTGLMFDHVIVTGLDAGTDWWAIDPRGTDMLMYQLCASAGGHLEPSAIGGWRLTVLDRLPFFLLDDCR